MLNFASQNAVILAPISDEPAANVNMWYLHAHSKAVGFLHWLCWVMILYSVVASAHKGVLWQS